MNAPSRVLFSPNASALVRRLKDKHGPLLFHQSGGCCDGSAPMCLRDRDFRVGSRDVLLGVVEGCPFYIGGAQFETWQHTQLIIDVIPGSGDSFSIEVLSGVRFITGSRVFSAGEQAALRAAGPPPTGPTSVSADLGEQRT
jgi:uncharacterized protein (DUF779 family)